MGAALQWRGPEAGADPDRDALGGLPVPLADGRQVRGARGVLIPGPELDPEPLRELGLRVVHPEAAGPSGYPLLERLGGVRATPRSVLTDPAVRAAVANSYDDEDPESVSDAVLALVAAARPAPGTEPWLAELTLLDSGGELAPAGELVLPESPISEVVVPGALGTVADELVRTWGRDVLRAVGVLDTFALVTDADVVLDPAACEHDLDGEDDWLRYVLEHLGARDAEQATLDVPPVLPEMVAVRDLDLVADDAWPAALRMLARPPLRQVVTEPARALLADGRTGELVPYTAWWLRHHPVLGGRAPAGLRAAGSDPLLAGLYDEAVTELDTEFLRALGVRTSLAGLLGDPDGPRELLDRLADPARTVRRHQLRELYRALAGTDPDRAAPAGPGQGRGGGPDRGGGRGTGGRGGRAAPAPAARRPAPSRGRARPGRGAGRPARPAGGQ